MTDKKPTAVSSRRKFLKGAAIAGAASIAMPQVSRAQTVTLKMQGSWGSGDIINDYAKQYVQLVNDMGGSRLKIDYLNAGSVVKAFEVQDAVSKGVLDGGHLVPAYWYGKNQRRFAVRHRPLLRLGRAPIPRLVLRPRPGAL